MKRAKAARKDIPSLEIIGPAIITPLHVMDRPATNKDMKPITGTAAWRKLTPLQAVFAKNQLAGGSPRYNAEERYQAGSDYTKIFDASQKGSNDSTQLLNLVGVGYSSSSGSAQARASDSLATIHSHMGQRDRKIIEMVCGEGYWPSEAVRTVCGDYKDTVSARFREALDSLTDAMETTRRMR